MREKITTATVKKLLAGAYSSDTLADTEVRGFQAKLRASGAVTFSLRYSADGQRFEKPLGVFGNVTAEQARILAKQNAGKVAGGTNVFRQEKEAKKRNGKTVNAVLDDFEMQYLGKKKDGVNRIGRDTFSYTLKSGWQYSLSFDVYVRPAIGRTNIYDLKRSSVAGMLKKIGVDTPVMADRALAHLRKALNWFATQDDDFNSPIVKGMALTKPSKRKRQRKLDDQEIRDLWLALDECQAQSLVPPCFPAFVRTLFLTATRLRMVADMHRDEIDGRIWTVPEERNKVGIPFAVYLTDEVQTLLRSRNSHPFVFSNNDGATAVGGFGKPKKALDAKLAEIRKREGRKPMAQWTFHDFRRTARGLMKLGGIDPDTCERVLAHVIPGVRGVYDVEDYLPEKTRALKVLAEQVNRVLRGRSAKVVEFRRRAA